MKKLIDKILVKIKFWQFILILIGLTVGIFLLAGISKPDSLLKDFLINISAGIAGSIITIIFIESYFKKEEIERRKKLYSHFEEQFEFTLFYHLLEDLSLLLNVEHFQDNFPKYDLGKTVRSNYILNAISQIRKANDSAYKNWDNNNFDFIYQFLHRLHRDVAKFSTYYIYNVMTDNLQSYLLSLENHLSTFSFPKYIFGDINLNKKDFKVRRNGFRILLKITIDYYEKIAKEFYKGH